MSSARVTGRRLILALRSTPAMALFTMMLFGTAFYALVVALEDVPPVLLATTRSSLASVFLVGLLLVFWERTTGTPRGDLTVKRLATADMKGKGPIWLILGFALFSTLIPNVMQNVGMTMMDPSSTSSLSSLIQGIGPVLTIFLAAFILREHLDRWKVLGLTITLPATLILTTYGPSGFQLASDTTLGGLLNLGTAASYSISAIFLKSALNRGGNPILLVTVNMIIGSILIIPIQIMLMVIGWESPADLLNISFSSFLAIIYLSISIAAIASFIWYLVLQREKVSKAIFYIFLLPAFPVLLGYLLLGERLDIVQIAAGLSVLLGVFVSQRKG
ncbi:MAG: DMT family transporter [Thermoplasmata archaeon]|nr:DMT family transporter [Thermoplasmata archaeon]